MANGRSSPLQPADLAALRQALASCGEAEMLIDKAERCGADCRAHRAMCQAIRERAAAMLREFGPTQSRE